MLEFLLNPINFLHDLAVKSKCKFFTITVKYLTSSRIGMYGLRNNTIGDLFAERVYIFELSLIDWIFTSCLSGWKVKDEDSYKQYSKRVLLNFTKLVWGKTNFEGFYILILSKNIETVNRYQDWKELQKHFHIAVFLKFYIPFLLIT